MPPSAPPLYIYTIYRSPSDYRGWYVCRRHLITPDGSLPELQPFALSVDLPGIYSFLPEGLTCLGREPGDEPQIVESWI